MFRMNMDESFSENISEDFIDGKKSKGKEAVITKEIIEGSLREIDVNRYIFVAYTFTDSEHAEVSVVRSWRGLAKKGLNRMINVLLDFGHLLKMIAFDPAAAKEVCSFPILELGRLGKEEISLYETKFSNALLVCLYYSDMELALGEVPVTQVLYRFGLKKPIIFSVTSDVSTSLVIGVLGDVPQGDKLIKLKEILQNFMLAFESCLIPRHNMKITHVLDLGF